MDKKKVEAVPDRDLEDIIAQEEFDEDLEAMLLVIDAENVDDEDEQ